MKLEYLKPELEISAFEAEDIITLSNGGELTEEDQDYGLLFPAD